METRRFRHLVRFFFFFFFYSHLTPHSPTGIVESSLRLTNTCALFTTAASTKVRNKLLWGYKQYTYIKLYKNNRYLQYLLEYVPYSSGYNN